MRKVRNFVNGQHVDAKDGRTLALVNPATGEEFGTSPLSAAADVDAAMSSAAAAFDDWKDTTPSERSRALLRIADAILDDAFITFRYSRNLAQIGRAHV